MAGITVAVDLPLVAVIGAAVGNIVVAGAIAIGVYHLVIGTSVRTADVLPGALITAVGVYAITLLGGLYVKHVVARMSGVYGPFASTIGLLAYVSLTVQIFVVATEVSIVRPRRLWPRALTSDLAEPDLRKSDRADDGPRGARRSARPTRGAEPQRRRWRSPAPRSMTGRRGIYGLSAPGGTAEPGSVPPPFRRPSMTLPVITAHATSCVPQRTPRATAKIEPTVARSS